MPLLRSARRNRKSVESFSEEAVQLFGAARCCSKSSDEFHVILHRQGDPKPLRAFQPTHIKALDGLVGLRVVAVRIHGSEGSRLAQQPLAGLHNSHSSKGACSLSVEFWTARLSGLSIAKTLKAIFW